MLWHISVILYLKFLGVWKYRIYNMARSIGFFNSRGTRITQSILTLDKKGRKTWPCYYNAHMSVNFVILSDLHVYAHFLFVLFSVHLCIILDTPSTRDTCPAGWSMFGTSCYTTSQQQLSWMNASVTTPSAPSQHLTFEDYEIVGSLKLYIDFKNNTVALIFFVFLLRWSAWHTVQNLSK